MKTNLQKVYTSTTPEITPSTIDHFTQLELIGRKEMPEPQKLNPPRFGVQLRTSWNKGVFWRGLVKG